jgi:hypothetical protein
VPISADVGVSEEQDVGPTVSVPDSVASELPGFTADVRAGEILMFPLGYWHSTQVSGHATFLETGIGEVAAGCRMSRCLSLS